MTSLPPKNDSLEWVIFLSALMEAAREEGMVIDIDTRASIARLLRELPPDTELQRLRTLLCPLIAKSEKEQKAFYRLFRNYENRLKRLHSEEPPETPSPEQNQEQWLPLKTMLISAGLSLLLLAGLIGFQKWIAEGPEPAVMPGPVAAMQEKDGQTKTSPAKSSSSSNDTIRYISLWDTFPAPRHPREDSIQQAYISKAASAQNKRQVKETVWWGAVFLGLLYIIYTLLRRRQLVIRRFRERPPFIWRIQPPSVSLTQLKANMNPVALRLQQRIVSDYRRLDLTATVKASARRAGFPRLIYQDQSRPAEYLLLIDRRGKQHQQLELFERLYELLREKAVEVRRFYYEGDPRVCWNQDYPAGLYLPELYRKYRDYRLLLFGEAGQLISPVTGRQYSWVRQFEQWKDRALLTPAGDSYTELLELKRLQGFVITPSTPDGMISVVRQFEESPEPVTEDRWREQVKDQKPLLEVDDENLVSSLQHLGVEQPLLTWIAACAVYPELNWELTLCLGEALESAHNWRLLNLDNVLWLSRLSWFREGGMPVTCRRQLLEYLPEEDIQLVRETIIGILHDNTPPESRAEGERQMRLAIQRAMLDPADRKKRRALRRQLASASKPDPLVLDILNKPYSWLDFWLPDFFQRFFFTKGYAFFGPKYWILCSLFALTSLGIWMAPVGKEPSRFPYTLRLLPYDYAKMMGDTLEVRIGLPEKVVAAATPAPSPIPVARIKKAIENGAPNLSAVEDAENFGDLRIYSITVRMDHDGSMGRPTVELNGEKGRKYELLDFDSLSNQYLFQGNIIARRDQGFLMVTGRTNGYREGKIRVWLDPKEKTGVADLILKPMR